MNWLATFRDECFNSHPIFYTLLIVLLGFFMLLYVWKFEKALKEEHRLDRNKGPFR